MELNPAVDSLGLAAGRAAAERQSLLVVDEDRALTFGELTDKYYRRIFNLICYQVGDADEAADLTQETFVKAFRAYHTFKGEARVSTWLWRIAINMCKSNFRKRSRRERLIPLSLDAEISTEDGEMTREPADWSVCPENIIQTRELCTQVRDAIAALPDTYRVSVILCDMEGCSYQEIADITGVTVQAVKSRIHRARRMLKVKLEGYVQA